MEHSSPDQLPENVISIITQRLAGNDVALGAFNEGLGKCIHFLSVDPGVETQQRLLRFVSDWAIDVVMDAHDGWRTDVEDSERAIAAGELGEPVSGEELRELLKH